MYLNIPIKKSYVGKNLVLGCYLLCCFAIHLTNLNYACRLIVFSLLVYCVYKTLKKYFFSIQTIQAISYYDNQWKIKIANQQVTANLKKYFTAYGIVCLYYNVNNKNYSLVLFQDSYSQDEMHKLQLGLKLKIYSS